VTSSSQDLSWTLFEDILSKLGDIGQSLHRCQDLDTILATGVTTTREWFGCDRALVYQLLPEGDGLILAESVGADTPAMVGQLIHDPCLERQWIEPYRQGCTSAVDDVDQSELALCHLELLKQVNVRANLVAPIVVPAGDAEADSQLWGLLMLHECHAPRRWQPVHHQVLKQIGTHMGLALCQHQTRQQLEQCRQRETRWQTALEATQDGVWDWNAATDEVFFSHEWKTMLGYAEAEVGNTLEEWKSRVHPDDLDGVLALLQQHLAGQTRLYRSEHRMLAKDGRWRWILDRGKVVAWRPDGQPLRVVGTHTDVSDRKQAELALREREAFLGSIYDGVDLSIFVVDVLPDGGYCYAGLNPAHERLTGISNDTLRGKRPDQILPPDVAATVVACYQRCVEADTPIAYEECLPFQGETLYWLTKLTPLRDQTTGQITRLIGTSVEVSELKHMEAALRESQQKYQTLFQTLPIGIAITDHQGNLVEVNPAAGQAFCVPLPSQLSLPTPANQWTLIRPDGSPLPLEEYPCVLARREQRVVQNVELGIAGQRGTVQWLSVSASPIPLEHYGVAVAYIDITDLKQAKDLLWLQSTALNASANMIVITDQDGHIEWANPAFTSLTGYPLQDAIGQTPGDLLRSGEQTSDFYETLWHTITTGQTWQGELVNRRQDGSLYTEAMTITPVQDDHGNIRHFVAIKQDVTERHRMEQRLRERDEMLRKISQQVPGVVYQYRLDADGHSCFPYASEAIRRIYEVTPEQVQTDAQLVLERLHPEDYDRVVESILTSFNTLELWHEEYRVQLPDRGERWLEGHAMPERLADGGVLWHGYIWDITERKQLQLSIQNSEAFFRGVFEQAIVGISMIGTDQKFQLVNQRFCDLMGYTETELRHKSFLELTHPDDFAQSLAYFRQVMQGAVSNSGLEKRYIRKDREVWWANVAISPIYDDQGNLQHIFSIVVDITARKLAEAQLQREFQRERMIHLIDHHIRKSLDLDIILQTTVQEVRQFLATDRVIIYRLNPDWTGVVMAESVAPGWLSILNRELADIFFVDTQNSRHHYSQMRLVDDIYTDDFSDDHLKLLESMQVRAKLVVPILQGEHQHPWGLLIAHHCREPRPWQTTEGRLLQQLTHQLALAIQHAELHHRLQTANQELETISNTDALTQIHNRRYFDQSLADALTQAHWAHQSLALILCDIDHFKQYNDTYGHPAGDACLVAVAKALQQCLKRPTDCLARYGGEEFAVILPHTDLAGAISVVQEMQQAIAALNIDHKAHQSSSQVTLSFGITALVPNYQTSPQVIIDQADQALYDAKAEGRNDYRCFSGHA
jgi:diguanylate cyclase (GGDEF)-like protein/PAS domain S-box-containing protein